MLPNLERSTTQFCICLKAPFRSVTISDSVDLLSCHYRISWGAALSARLPFLFWVDSIWIVSILFTIVSMHQLYTVSRAWSFSPFFLKKNFFKT